MVEGYLEFARLAKTICKECCRTAALMKWPAHCESYALYAGKITHYQNLRSRILVNGIVVKKVSPFAITAVIAFFYPNAHPFRITCSARVLRCRPCCSRNLYRRGLHRHPGLPLYQGDTQQIAFCAEACGAAQLGQDCPDPVGFVCYDSTLLEPRNIYAFPKGAAVCAKKLT